MLALSSSSGPITCNVAPFRRPLLYLSALHYRCIHNRFRCTSQLYRKPRTAFSCRGRVSVLRVEAMVNVDVSPSVLMGVGLIGAGVSLWQIRQVKPEISKDYDVVISCVSLLVGGILIFQGWRLDPLLLFGQIMTTGAAVSFAIEALRLRSEQYEGEEKAQLRSAIDRNRPPGDDGVALQLPPPPPDMQQPWSSSSGRQGAWEEMNPEQQQQWGPAYSQRGAGYPEYYYAQQQSQPPAGSSGYGQPQYYQPGQGGDSSGFDYLGDPSTSYSQQQQGYFSDGTARNGSDQGQVGSQPYFESDFTTLPSNQGAYSQYTPPFEYIFPQQDQYPPGMNSQANSTENTPGEQTNVADWRQQQQQGSQQTRRPAPSSYDAEDWD